MHIDGALERGRTAFAERRWDEARRLLSGAERGSLAASDLELLATAAYLSGDDERSVDGWAQAQQRHLDDGQAASAARCAFWAGLLLANQGEMAPAAGWFARAQRLVEEAGDCAERGYLLVPAGLAAFAAGRPEVALDHFRTATEIGRRFAEVDLATLGQLGTGQAQIMLDDIEAGLRLLDEAMVAVMAEEVGATVAGIVYCAVIEACHVTYDVRRARQWTDALTRWCDHQPELVAYRGQCLVHRSEILQMHGEWADALDEVRRACDRLAAPTPRPALGAAHYQRADLHRLRGELGEAAEAYALAHRWGRDPQPGMALLRFAEGDVASAAATIRRVLDETPVRLARPRVLGAATEILLAASDLPAASAAAHELHQIATEVGAPYLQAMADSALGAVCLAERAPSAAVHHLRRAADAWHEIGAPLERARALVLAAAAYRDIGDGDAARLDLDVAARIFGDLGASVDLRRLDGLDSPAAPDHGLTARELEVLRLVSTGSTNRAMADELVLSERTIERHLSNIFTKLGVSTRSAATAFAYEHDLV